MLPSFSPAAAGFPTLENPIFLILLLFGFALVPFVLLSFTSFLKLSVVFHILRNALGGGQIPSGVLVSLLSFVLTMQIMAPVAREAAEKVQAMLVKQDSENKGKSQKRKKGVRALLLPLKRGSGQVQQFFDLMGTGIVPFGNFLCKHSRPKERLFFAHLQSLPQHDEHDQRAKGQSLKGLQEFPSLIEERVEKQVTTAQSSQAEDSNHSPLNSKHECTLEGENIFSLLPAFVLSELQQAFAIGFTIFLPFLVIDLVVSNLLIGLGMTMMNPITFSFPLKLVLFVLCDGWFLLCRGLVLGYQ